MRFLQARQWRRQRAFALAVTCHLALLSGVFLMPRRAAAPVPRVIPVTVDFTALPEPQPPEPSPPEPPPPEPDPPPPDAATPSGTVSTGAANALPGPSTDTSADTSAEDAATPTATAPAPPPSSATGLDPAALAMLRASLCAGNAASLPDCAGSPGESARLAAGAPGFGETAGEWVNPRAERFAPAPARRLPEKHPGAIVCASKENTLPETVVLNDFYFMSASESGNGLAQAAPDPNWCN